MSFVRLLPVLSVLAGVVPEAVFSQGCVNDMARSRRASHHNWTRADDDTKQVTVRWRVDDCELRLDAEGDFTARPDLSAGKAAEQFRRIIEKQGGNPEVLDDPSLLPQAAECELFTAQRAGFVQRVEPRTIGRGIIALGGGRTTMADTIDPAVGFVITAKPGDPVEAGEPLASVYARDRAGIERGRSTLRKAITIGDDAEPPLPLVSHRVTKAGVEELV